MKLYVIIVMDTADGPYTWADETCPAEAEIGASQARHETGYATVVKCIDLKRTTMVQVILNDRKIGMISHANLDTYLASSKAAIISRTESTIVLKG